LKQIAEGRESALQTTGYSGLVFKFERNLLLRDNHEQHRGINGTPFRVFLIYGLLRFIGPMLICGGLFKHCARIVQEHAAVT